MNDCKAVCDCEFAKMFGTKINNKGAKKATVYEVSVVGDDQCVFCNHYVHWLSIGSRARKKLKSDQHDSMFAPEKDLKEVVYCKYNPQPHWRESNVDIFSKKGVKK